MRNGLYLAKVYHKRFFDKTLAVTRNTGFFYSHTLGHHTIYLLERAHYNFYRVALVARIERVKQRAVLAYKSKFACGRTRVYTQKGIALVIGKVSFFNYGLAVAFLECIIIILVRKKRVET